MHCVGWVYRNVRACNVLRSGKIGKLDDLQYAKCMDPKTTHELRRYGTLDFMACEVGAQGYLFEPHICRPFGYEHECPFRFHPIHDVESVWWTAT
ncbi:hypothetical protein BKA83DRAFT_4050481 [Pisolithus microcarpus]|nr:hypothetical protein BKA83DRAFT_4050481 [Pisolithus microcarpus]